MREVKFRAWDGDLMHSVADLIFNMGPNLDGKGICFYGPGAGQGRVDGEKVVLMEYSGLRDRKGVYIYEGDITKNQRGIIEQVIFDEGAFWQNETLLCYLNDSIEVIGNIHQHPHLLKEAAHND